MVAKYINTHSDSGPNRFPGNVLSSQCCPRGWFFRQARVPANPALPMEAFQCHQTETMPFQYSSLQHNASLHTYITMPYWILFSLFNVQYQMLNVQWLMFNVDVEWCDTSVTLFNVSALTTFPNLLCLKLFAFSHLILHFHHHHHHHTVYCLLCIPLHDPLIMLPSSAHPIKK